MMKRGVQRRLVAALGADAVQSNVHGDPRITASDPESVRRAVEILAQERQPFTPVGRGSTVRGVVEVQAARGVFDLWPQELVVRVGAATSVAELDAELEPYGLALGIVDAAPPTTPLGSLFASGDRGLRGAVGEGLRERALALTLVDGTGTVRRSGSRVVKSVAGYDLTRIHHGARGSLGLVLDLTLRVSARPVATGVVAIACPLHDLVETLTRARTAAQDAKAELWINASTAAGVGLGPEPRLIVMREAPAEGLEAWARSLDAELRGSELLREIGDSRWRGTDAVFRATGVTLRRCTSATTDSTDDADLVIDLLSAEAWANPMASSTRSLRDFAGLGVALWPENLAAHLRAGRELVLANDPVRARTERRLREVFDPFGLLPAAPVPRVHAMREARR